MKTFSINVVRPAYATVLVQAENLQEAYEKSRDRAHETVGIDEYTYGDFKPCGVNWN